MRYCGLLLCLILVGLSSACVTATSDAPSRPTRDARTRQLTTAEHEATNDAPPQFVDPILTNTENTESAKCISWKEAHLHVGEETCVTGVVTSTYNSGKAFFINFSSNRASFYLVSFDFTWDNLRGNCVQVRGKIILYEKRPEIILRDPNQLTACP